MSQELKSLFGSSESIEIAGVKIEIRDIRLDQIPDLVSLLKHYESSQGKSIQEILMTIIASEKEVIFGLIEGTTSLELEEVKKLNIPAALMIAEKILAVNWSFLEQHLPKIFENMGKTFKGLNKTAQKESGPK